MQEKQSAEICIECEAWNKAVIEAGFYFGMCEKCVNERFVPIKILFEVERKYAPN